MNLQPLVAAVVGLLLMLLVGVAYFLASRRWPKLAHPISIILFVMVVGVTVSVLGELYRGGWAGVPAMVRRSAIGAAGWGVVIAAVAWAIQRGLATRGK